jgi:hypothetical protein
MCARLFQLDRTIEGDDVILGSFVLFGCACLLLFVFPPFAFMAWLVSVVMFFSGLSSRRAERRVERRLRNESHR